MRTIKFRAWDYKNKIMLKPGDCVDKGIFPGEETRWLIWADGSLGVYSGNDGGKSGLWEHFDDERAKDLKLLRYTGLLDKNKKEIYEGDVVRQFIPSSKSYYSGEVYYSQWCRFEVGDGWALVDGESQIDDDESKKWEIIGNIYENPELLGMEG